MQFNAYHNKVIYIFSIKPLYPNGVHLKTLKKIILVLRQSNLHIEEIGKNENNGRYVLHLTLTK